MCPECSQLSKLSAQQNRLDSDGETARTGRVIRAGRHVTHRGFTVVEMIIAVGLVSMIGVAMATLSTAAHTSNGYVEETGEAIQHARVTIERVRRAIQSAHASDEFPGFVVATSSVSTWTFYDTLAVWTPSGAAANPDGLPQVGELVLFSFDVNEPNRLLQITVPGNTTTVPATTDAIGWSTLVASMKVDSDAVEVELTDLLHTAEANGTGTDRGVLQFNAGHHPSETEWSGYEAGDTAFEDLPWALDIHGDKSGLRQSRVSFDFQLQPDRSTAATTASVIPFFGSAAIYYELKP